MRTVAAVTAGGVIGVLAALLMLWIGVAKFVLLVIVLALVAIALGLADWLRTHG